MLKTCSIFLKIEESWQGKLVVLFLAISFSLSLFSVFMRMPASWPDEQIHYYRAIQLSQGNILEKSVDSVDRYGGNVSISQAEFMDEDFDLIANPNGESYFGLQWIKRQQSLEFSDQSVFKETTSAVPYNPLIYSPYYLPLWIGRLFQLSPVAEFIFVRIGGLLFAYIVLLYAIRSLPFSKLTLAGFTLHPTLFVGFSAITADTFTNVIVILFISYMVKIIYSSLKQIQVRKSDVVKFSIIILLLSVAKIPAFFILLSVFPLIYFLRIQKLITKKQLIYLLIATFLSILFVFAWIMAVRHINTGAYFGRNTDMKQQLHYIISNIPQFIKIYLFALISYDYTSMQLGYANNPIFQSIPNVYITLYIAGLIFTTFIQDKHYTFMKENRLLSLVQFSKIISFVGIVTATFLILYLQFSIVGSSVIEGVQPRYFLPYFLLLLTYIPRKYIFDSKVYQYAMVLLILPASFYLLCMIAQIL
ncbi:DUF2142 domain-containing protein [Streptococcus marmotae]|uniref:DUF2142 domain-containing protein n=1 Tax=Streptococcus marmotae TaxID=1825069 RepID=UPI00082D29A2|nr:DUF2142 domain-containing protein [Streptococcus marmotae]